MTGDLARMQSDDSYIITAVSAANVCGLDTYQKTVVRATAAIEARQLVFAPLDNVCVGDDLELIDCQDIQPLYVEALQEVTFVRNSEGGLDGAYSDAIDAAIEAEDREHKRAYRREVSRAWREAWKAQDPDGYYAYQRAETDRKRSKQRAGQPVGVGANG